MNFADPSGSAKLAYAVSGLPAQAGNPPPPKFSACLRHRKNFSPRARVYKNMKQFMFF